MKKNVNPSVKKGDEIVYLKSNNGHPYYEGTVLVVITARKSRSQNNFTAAPKNPVNGRSQQINVYYSGPADEFCMATKEILLESLLTKIKTLRSEIKGKEEEIVGVQKEYDFQVKYDSEEQFVAEKLENLVTTAMTTGKDQKTRIATMTAILKELKTSHIL